MLLKMLSSQNPHSASADSSNPDGKPTSAPAVGPPGSAAAGGASALTPGLSASEEKRTSLLDVVRDNLQRQGKNTMLYRVVVCGELVKDADRADFGAYYQKFFKQYQTETDLITGMLLVLPGCFVHVLEASHKVILSFLRDLKTPPSSSTTRTRTTHLTSHHAASVTTEPKPSEGGPTTTTIGGGTPGSTLPLTAGMKLRSCRVLCLADDIPARFYPFWASRVVDPRSDAAEADADFETEDAGARTVADLCIKFATLGASLSSLSKSDLKPALDELGDRYRNLIPRPEFIIAVSSESHVMSVDEWCELFDGHLEVVLESDLVWPVPRPLVF
ncbi:hypothetical protein HK104_006445 [Borealophlyctis nickersoniae]|nr:hypothetical protein HK104_006445 [Borealophlyctis nickersoniae]